MSSQPQRDVWFELFEPLLENVQDCPTSTPLLHTLGNNADHDGSHDYDSCCSRLAGHNVAVRNTGRILLYTQCIPIREEDLTSPFTLDCGRLLSGPSSRSQLFSNCAQNRGTDSKRLRNLIGGIEMARWNPTR